MRLKGAFQEGNRARPAAGYRFHDHEIGYSASGEVFCEALVNQSDDFIERAELEPFLDGDSADQAIDAFDVFGAAEKRTRCGRGFAEAFGCIGVLVEGNKVAGVGTE